MKPVDVLHKLEKVAPVSLSDDFCKKYNLYDNSGLIINCGEEASGVLFALDLSMPAVKEAAARGYNLIVTHHPAIYGGISKLDAVSNPQSAVLCECVRRGISVISMHLNFDAAPRGIDYYLMRGLGGENPDILAPVNGGGYGRLYSVNYNDFGEMVQKARAEFSRDKLLAYGDMSKKIGKAASFCGAGCDDKAIAFAVSGGADVFVSSDMKHHEITALLSHGINVLHMTHYASENYGFNKIYSDIKEKLELPSVFYNNAEL